MTSRGNVEERLTRLRQTIGPNGLLVENIMRRINDEPCAEPGRIRGLKNRITARKFIMSRLRRFATAAAIIVGVVSGLYCLITFGGTRRAYGMSDVVELINNARTLHIQGRYFSEKGFASREREPLPFDYWYDMENGCFRISKSMFDWLHPKQVNNITRVFDSEYIMTVVSPEEAVSFRKLADFQSRLHMRKLGKSIFWGDFGRDILGDIAGSRYVGKEKVGRTDFDIWEVEFSVPHQTQERRCMIRSWVRRLTRELEQVRVWEKQGDREWYRLLEVDRCERDIEPPRDAFGTEPPAGFKLENTKETASMIDLGGTGLSPLDETQYRLLLNIHIAFTLSDGSVIVCWRSRDVSEPFQAEYFQDLETGGDLPKLPVTIHALTTMPEVEHLRYVGYHLTYTQKGDNYYEWSLYVPDEDPPSRSTIFGYQAHQRYNTNNDVRVEYSNTAVYDDLTIETEQEFNTWVLGAMAELNADGEVPENVAYESVLRLSKGIREALAE